jgi:hypothetical protein
MSGVKFRQTFQQLNFGEQFFQTENDLKANIRTEERCFIAKQFLLTKNFINVSKYIRSILKKCEMLQLLIFRISFIENII